jgi:hypothetical protein
MCSAAAAAAAHTAVSQLVFDIVPPQYHHSNANANVHLTL